MELKALEDMIKLMRKHGVEHLTAGDVHLKMFPRKVKIKDDGKMLITPELSDEDLINWSSAPHIEPE